jgi:hypothetical protein
MMHAMKDIDQECPLTRQTEPAPRSVLPRRASQQLQTHHTAAPTHRMRQRKRARVPGSASLAPSCPRCLETDDVNGDVLIPVTSNLFSALSEHRLQVRCGWALARESAGSPSRQVCSSEFVSRTLSPCPLTPCPYPLAPCSRPPRWRTMSKTMSFPVALMGALCATSLG